MTVKIMVFWTNYKTCQAACQTSFFTGASQTVQLTSKLVRITSVRRVSASIWGPAAEVFWQGKEEREGARCRFGVRP